MASARKKLLLFFQENIGKALTKEKLANVAGVYDWARSIRSLRQEGYDIELLKNGSYVMHSTTKSSSGTKRVGVDSKTRYRILQRDNSVCQRCGRGVNDGVKLAIDHKIPVELGGENSDDNLWVLCEECNLGKKHWFSDENAESMKRILAEKSGTKRLEKYFEEHPNVLIEPATLQVVSGIRDWERTLRMIRQNKNKVIRFVKKEKESGKEGYIYTPR